MEECAGKIPKQRLKGFGVHPSAERRSSTDED
jgi:hypothetical protein